MSLQSVHISAHGIVVDSEYRKEVRNRLVRAALISVAVCAVGLFISSEMHEYLGRGGEGNPLVMLPLILAMVVGLFITMPWCFLMGPFDTTWPISLSINLFLVLSAISIRRLRRIYWSESQ